jgi:hypothetical protein
MLNEAGEQNPIYRTRMLHTTILTSVARPVCQGAYSFSLIHPKDNDCNVCWCVGTRKYLILNFYVINKRAIKYAHSVTILMPLLCFV